MTASLADVELYIDFDLSLEDDENHDKCHLSCRCRKHLALCGAYKAVSHGVPLLETVNSDGTIPSNCPICNKLCCLTCISMADDVCIYCGE
jgi:hypothetical protein